MKIKIIGEGVFGQFLKEILAPFVELSEDAEHIFLESLLLLYFDSVRLAKGARVWSVI